MKKELNIAAILKDKPEGTKLWSPIFGNCKFSRLSGSGIRVFPIHNGFTSTEEKSFFVTGQYTLAGEVSLFPSKQMRDWRKFSWKKGDVLICGFGNLCIFDKWCNEEYIRFDAKFISPDYGGAVLKTNNWSKVLNESTNKRHIAKIEGINGGKLNLETLEIEHTEPKQEFKDGDILFYENPEDEDVCSSIFIFRGKQNHTPGFLYHAVLDSDGFFNAKDGEFEIYEGKSRLATDSEKQQLFSALAKEGKRWNPDTKQIEDLPKKCEFKPMDWCLMKDSTKYWELCQFAYTRKIHGTTIYSAVGGLIYYKCIPYNDQTKHLLGTTDEWKGGEG